MYESLSAVYTAVVKIEIAYRTTKDEDKTGSPDIMISLNAPPVVGTELVHPKANDAQVLNPTIVFSLQRDDIPRFHEALKSRGLVISAPSIR